MTHLRHFSAPTPMLAMLSAGLALTACTHAGGKPTLPEEAVNVSKAASGTPTPSGSARLYRITDAGDVYAAINQGDCLRWPSERAKTGAGPAAWGGYYPAEGDVGALMSTARHCDTGTTVYILSVGDKYVAVGEHGVQPADGGGVGAGGERYRITDSGDIYPGIHESDCLPWPNEDLRRRAGSSAWKGWEPANGQEGVLVARMKHCDTGIQVLVLQVDDHLVPIGESGVERLGGGGVAVPSVPSGGGAGAPRIGASYRMVNAGELYSTINKTDCLAWPSDEIKRKASPESWGGYSPKEGDVGTLVATSRHCDDPSVTVFILRVGANYVAMGSRGLVEIAAPQPAVPPGRTGGGASAGQPQVGATYRITDVGKLYSTINATDCLKWPSDEIKRKAGADAWGGYYPKNGDTGTLAGTSPHCSSGLTVYILKIGEIYVPIGEAGVQAVTGAGGTATPTAGQLGGRYRIVDSGEVYSTINEVECLRWPNDDIKRRAGEKSWGGYTPSKDEEGTLVGTSPHCSSASTIVFILKIGERYVPIGMDGVAPAK